MFLIDTVASTKIYSVRITRQVGIVHFVLWSRTVLTAPTTLGHRLRKFVSTDSENYSRRLRPGGAANACGQTGFHLFPETCKRVSGIVIRSSFRYSAPQNTNNRPERKLRPHREAHKWPSEAGNTFGWTSATPPRALGSASDSRPPLTTPWARSCCISPKLRRGVPTSRVSCHGS